MAAEYQLKERKLDFDTYRKKAVSAENGAAQEFFKPIFLTLKAIIGNSLSEEEQRGRDSMR